MLLSRHPRLEVLVDTNFYPIFERLRHCYEPLSNQKSLARFVGEVARVSRHMPLKLSAQDILARVAEPTFPGVFAAWLQAYARGCGKPRGGEKTPQHCLYLDAIVRDLGGSPIIFLVRDPRDSAYSGLRSFNRSLASMATEWNEAIRALTKHRDRVLLVRYERLVAEPEATLRELCAGLGEPWDPALLNPSMTTALFRERHHGHERLGEPIDLKSVGRFAAMEEPQIAWIERECAEEMRRLGYEPVTSAKVQDRAHEKFGSSAWVHRRRDRWLRGWSMRFFHWRLQIRSRLWKLQS